MNQNKIYVDALPCKISWTTPLLLICILATVASIALCAIGRISDLSFPSAIIGVAAFSCLAWLVFFALFASACSSLPLISTSTYFIAISGAISVISGAVYSVTDNIGFVIVNGVFGLLTLVGVIWLGNNLRKNYSSVLGDVGDSLMKIVKTFFAAILLAIVGLFFASLGSLGGVIGSILGIAGVMAALFAAVLTIWMDYMILADVILPIYQMLHWGHQEGITHNDMRNWVAKSNG